MNGVRFDLYAHAVVKTPQERGETVATHTQLAAAAQTV
jgi:hypothetical protein